MKRIFDLSIDIRERMFYVLGLTAILANTIGFMFNFLIYGMNVPTLVCGVCAAAIAALNAVGYITRKTSVPAVLLLTLVNVFEFPFLFYVYGSSVIVYMVLGCIGITVCAKEKHRLFIVLLTVLYDEVIIVYSYNNTSLFGIVDANKLLGSTVCSYAISMGCIVSIITLWILQSKKQQKELMRLNSELKHMSEIDPLTMTYNRRYFTKYLDLLICNPKAAFCVALLDIDNFKRINDEYSHVFGDEVLVKFSSIIKANLQEEDIVARFGGEEFMIVFRKWEEGREKAALEKIKEEFVAYSMETKGVEFTFSGGVEVFNRLDGITKMYKNVDEKLYMAKEQGKNMIIWHTSNGLTKH